MVISTVFQQVPTDLADISTTNEPSSIPHEIQLYVQKNGSDVYIESYLLFTHLVLE